MLALEYGARSSQSPLALSDAPKGPSAEHAQQQAELQVRQQQEIIDRQMELIKQLQQQQVASSRFMSQLQQQQLLQQQHPNSNTQPSSMAAPPTTTRSTSIDAPSERLPEGAAAAIALAASPMLAGEQPESIAEPDRDAHVFSQTEDGAGAGRPGGVVPDVVAALGAQGSEHVAVTGNQLEGSTLGGDHQAARGTVGLLEVIKRNDDAVLLGRSARLTCPKLDLPQERSLQATALSRS